MTGNNSKKIISVLILCITLLMAGCSQNSVTTEKTSEITSVSTTTKSYTDAKDLISKYTNNYITMNYEERSIYSKEEDVQDDSSEGGHLTKFYDGNDNLLRSRLILYGSMGKVEANYYFIDNQHGYYTVLSETYKIDPTNQSDSGALSYEFSEYWFDNDSIYSIDNVNGALIVSDTNPIIKPLLEYVNLD